MVIPESLHIVWLLTFGLMFATAFGYLAQKMRLSPIVGYLFAGYLIGPFSPGFVADLSTAEQLAEIGVILMMFGVGLHFKWEDLYSVKGVAIPGALVQTGVATLACIALLSYLGWTFEAGLVMGLAVGVASTVVLVRILSDFNLLSSLEGHIAVGWLIVEDIITVLALLLLPVLAASQLGSDISLLFLAKAVGKVLVQFFLMAALVLTLGKWLVAKVLFTIARSRIEELFTIAVLALIFAIATSTTFIFGTSVALGAFAAGMVIGQTVAKHQALAYSLPLKNTFAVIFFLAVGMLFNPSAIHENWGIFCAVLAIILLVKPLLAFLIMSLLRYPLKSAVFVAITLAQIGEFSFILAEEATKFKILPDDGYDILVACAIVSISLNPLFFRGALTMGKWLSKRRAPLMPTSEPLFFSQDKAVVVGFGPVGRKMTSALEAKGFEVVLIDQNIDTIHEIEKTGRQAIYGDASSRHILEAAGLAKAKILVITPPDLQVHLSTVHHAKEINPSLDILCRTRFEADNEPLLTQGVQVLCSEEETVKAIDKLFLEA